VYPLPRWELAAATGVVGGIAEGRFEKPMMALQRRTDGARPPEYCKYPNIGSRSCQISWIFRYCLGLAVIMYQLEMNFWRSFVLIRVRRAFERGLL
jgi:hypothetical protein